MQRAAEGAPFARRAAAAGALALWVLLADAWFAGPLLGGRVRPALAATSLVALLALGVALFRRRPRQPVPPAGRRQRALIMAGCLVAATLVRLPALTAPGSLVSSDSAVGGIIARELRDGVLPAPIYAPGFPYEGTLKPHLTALLGLLLPGVGTPLLYDLASHTFYLLWMAAVMALAARVAGDLGAAGAGLFMAVSPRFLAAFSLNNVGQYPEVNALGTLALLALAGGRGAAAAGGLLGLALWQQLLGLYFVIVAALAALVTPEWRRPRALAAGLAALLAGAYPVWVWNAANGWATFEWLRRGGKSPADRLADLPGRLEATLTVSLPKLFGWSDLGAPPAAATVLALLPLALVAAMTAARWKEVRAVRGRSVAGLVALLAAVVLAVFAISKFSHRGAQRPRYLIPLYTPVAVAMGWGLHTLWRRSRPAAIVGAAATLGVNAAGLAPWLGGREPAHERDRVFLDRLRGLDVRTGYAGFWVAPKYTFLADGWLVLSGELGPDVSWVHPAHAALVRERGPEAWIVGRGERAHGFAARLQALGVTFERETLVGHVVFHRLSRPVTLDDVAGYDTAVPEPVVPVSY